MKIPINLASQPFRRDRPMIMASLGVCLLLLASLGVLVSLALADRAQFADLRHEVDHLQSEIRKATAEQSQLDAVLRRPENAEVLERSVFLNALLRRKGISWTRIFADLEKVLPYNVRVIQIHPTVDALNRVSLDMQLGSDSPQPVIDLLKTMAAQPFSNPEIRTQQSPTQSEPLWRYRVSVEYAQKL
jgi:type IV pilus assembly protein PilN